MNRSAQTKGRELEQAVRAIEDTILSAAPGYAQGTFRIPSNRVINSAGVKHEVDIFVTASHAPGYESIFIFECKNWGAKVGKNEIIIFSEKVSAIGAQRGFFVASRFTRDAIAQARKDGRIQLLRASHTTPAIRVQFPQFHLMSVTKTDSAIEIKGFGRPKPLQAIDVSDKTVRDQRGVLASH